MEEGDAVQFFGTFTLINAHTQESVAISEGADVLVREHAADEAGGAAAAEQTFVCKLGHFFVAPSGIIYFIVKQWYAYPCASQQAHLGAVPSLGTAILKPHDDPTYPIYTANLIKRTLVMSRNPLWQPELVEGSHFF